MGVIERRAKAARARKPRHAAANALHADDSMVATDAMHLPSMWRPYRLESRDDDVVFDLAKETRRCRCKRRHTWESRRRRERRQEG
ncbi:MAG: hypothetical protein WDM91_19235 [Rhizomicrobium sp.]